jgi:hypothetical protein
MTIWYLTRVIHREKTINTMVNLWWHREFIKRFQNAKELGKKGWRETQECPNHVWETCDVHVIGPFVFSFYKSLAWSAFFPTQTEEFLFHSSFHYGVAMHLYGNKTLLYLYLSATQRLIAVFILLNDGKVFTCLAARKTITTLLQEWHKYASHLHGIWHCEWRE